MIKIKFLDSEQREQVGFSFIIDRLEVITPYGLEEKRNIVPFKKQDEHRLMGELNNIENLLQSLKGDKGYFREIERIFCKVKDIKGTVKRCRNLNTLDDVELYEIKYFALLIEELIGAVRKLDLNIEDIKLYPLKELVTLLDPGNKRISTFYVYDNYSEKLKGIRGEKKRIEEEIFKEIDLKKIQQLKEKRLDLVIQEEEEELNIRKKLSVDVIPYVSLIEKNIKIIGRLDFLISKAKLASEYNGIKPEITDERKINFGDIINPEIGEILKAKGKQFIPVSVELTSGTTVITGANMGGKSVALKTIVLNLLLGQCGFFVFGREAVMPIMDFIYFISDDMQSVSKGLSTFGAEVVKLKEVIECTKRENGFVALDEFARGTNPKEGSYLVKSLACFLNKYATISLISTHYDGAVEEPIVHYQVVGLKNVDFNSLKYKIDMNKHQSVEIIQEHMEYKLERVYKENEVPKDALNISLLLGLQDEVINIARKYYNEENK